ncbi:MAG TPA: PQQ-binding-like beta-propeller repeat protein [Thermomicrobiales bacterium]|nr:PQQ-binding-like beta-propeller repeat protein [Thermomicrobiales bacterium]
MRPRPRAARPRRRDYVRFLAALAAALALLPLLPLLGLGAPAARAAAAYDWLQFDGDAQHSGNNRQESIISAANVGQLQRVFRVALPDAADGHSHIADGAPAYLSGVSTPSGTRDLVFLTTKSGQIVALDAHTGALIWQHQHGAGSCHINGGSDICYTTSSPAIDPNRQYVYSYGLDGYARKYRVGDGTEITGGGWPELATLKGFDEKGSSALAIAQTPGGTFLYVANGGYPGDGGDYQGHITAIDLATGVQRVFNSQCSDQMVHFVKNGIPDCGTRQSAIWARPGVVYSAATNRIYMVTGNADFNPGAHNWGDTVFALNPNGTGANGGPLDSYTPTNEGQLNDADLDLGSAAPAILPVPWNPALHLGVQGGKDAELRLLDLDDLSRQGGPGHTGGEFGIVDVPQGGDVLTQPAVWTNPADGSTWVFVASYGGISALRLTQGAGGVPTLTTMWEHDTGSVTSPLVANGVLYYARDGVVRADDPATGNRLWQDTTIGGIHWESPVVANGMLYITDEDGTLTAYDLPGSPGPSPSPSPSPSPQPGGWSNWASLGGVLTDSPAAAGFNGRAYAFAKGSDSALYIRSSVDGVNWTAWAGLGGVLTAAPAAAGFPGHGLYVFAKGTDDALYLRSSPDGVTFSPWVSLGGVLTAPPAAASFNGRLYAFAKGSDNALYVRSSANGTNWSPWQSLGGVLTAAPAAASLGGRLYAFARGADGALYVRSSADGANWNAWASLGGFLTAAPAAASYTPSGGAATLVTFARGTDGALYTRATTDGAAWSAWQSLGGFLIGPPAAAGNGGRVYALVEGADAALYVRYTLP